jgi:hypothetical protein
MIAQLINSSITGFNMVSRAAVQIPELVFMAGIGCGIIIGIYLGGKR